MMINSNMILGTSYFFISMVALTFHFGVLYPSRAAEITSNIDGLACPGEELIYTCVSQGTSQRWHIENEDSFHFDQLYTSSDQLGVTVRGAYTFTLYSTSVSNFMSAVSVKAMMSMHDTRIECTGPPMSPLNLQSVVNEYRDHFSTVIFTWDVPDDNSRVDYYQYQVVSESSSVAYVHNTTNNSASISGIEYSKNVTFLVRSGNCIGQSAPLMKIVNVVGCSKLDEGVFNINHSAFSQAPGAEILLLCNDSDMIVHTTCREDGIWEPDANSALCLKEDPTNVNTISLTSTQNDNNIIIVETTLEPQIHFVPIFATGASAVVGLCILAGVIICCVCKLAIHWRREEPTGPSLLISKVEHYEVIEPIYETIKTDSTQSKIMSSGTQLMIMMADNDAYKTIKCVETASKGMDVANKEVYIQISPELDIVSMEHNSSYQATPFNSIFPGKQPVCNLNNIQQISGCIDTPMSQNDEPIEPQNYGVLCVKAVDMNSTFSTCDEQQVFETYPDREN